MQRDFVAQTFGQLRADQLAAFEELLILTRDLVRAQSSPASASEEEPVEEPRSLAPFSA